MVAPTFAGTDTECRPLARIASAARPPRRDRRAAAANSAKARSSRRARHGDRLLDRNAAPPQACAASALTLDASTGNRAAPGPPRRWSRCHDLPGGGGHWIFYNRAGRYLHPKSISQLFDRTVRRAALPHIRFHDLRHTRASLLVASGEAIKIGSERLGHAHPCLHHAHLPAPVARHERRRGRPLRHAHRHRQAVDTSAPPSRTAGQAHADKGAGRRRRCRDPANNEGPDRRPGDFPRWRGQDLEPATVGV